VRAARTPAVNAGRRKRRRTEGGYGGGTVVAEGTPEEVAAVPASHTGKFLREVLGDRFSDATPARRTTRKKAPAKKAVAGRKSTAKK
ncbi:hypothetical protein ACWC9S_26985, partial [Streptomyces xiamenensis]